MGGEIQGRTLGIVGLGHSGRELVRLVAPFAMRVIAFSPHADPARPASLGVRLTSLEEVLRESDFVSLHCRLTGRDARLDRRGATGLDEAVGLLHQRRPRRAGRPAGAVRPPARSQDRRRRPRCLRGRAACRSTIRCSGSTT